MATKKVKAESITYDTDVSKKLINNYWSLAIIENSSMRRIRDIFIKAKLQDEITPGDKLLEIGTGTGHMAYIFAENCKAQVNTIDIEDLRTPAMQKKVGNFFIASATEMPFKKNEFDIVTIIDVLHHCKDQEEIFKEIYRVLKPGGKLVLIDHMLYEKKGFFAHFQRNLLQIIDDGLNLQSKGKNPHTYRSYLGWKEILKKSGFFEPNLKTSWTWGIVDFIPLFSILFPFGRSRISYFRPIKDGVLIVYKQ